MINLYWNCLPRTMYTAQFSLELCWSHPCTVNVYFLVKFFFLFSHLSFAMNKDFHFPCAQLSVTDGHRRTKMLMPYLVLGSNSQISRWPSLCIFYIGCLTFVACVHCLCLCTSLVCVSLFYAAIEIFSMNKVDHFTSKTRILVIFSNNSNKCRSILMIFSTANRQ